MALAIKRDDVRVFQVSPDKTERYVDDVAALRIEVFRDWPYLYDGDMDYERGYLLNLVESSRSALILAEADGQIVGASTAMPLEDEHENFKRPFEALGMDLSKVYYLAESVLLPAYRGQGIGHRFFDLREAHGRAIGEFAMFAFCAVDRSPLDPRRPGDYRDLDAFWTKRGYVKNPVLRCKFDWKEVGSDDETTQTLTFWTRMLA